MDMIASQPIDAKGILVECWKPDFPAIGFKIPLLESIPQADGFYVVTEVDIQVTPRRQGMSGEAAYGLSLFPSQIASLKVDCDGVRMPMIASKDCTAAWEAVKESLASFANVSHLPSQAERSLCETIGVPLGACFSLKGSQSSPLASTRGYAWRIVEDFARVACTNLRSEAAEITLVESAEKSVHKGAALVRLANRNPAAMVDLTAYSWVQEVEVTARFARAWVAFLDQGRWVCAPADIPVLEQVTWFPRGTAAGDSVIAAVRGMDRLRGSGEVVEGCPIVHAARLPALYFDFSDSRCVISPAERLLHPDLDLATNVGVTISTAEGDEHAEVTFPGDGGQG